MLKITNIIGIIILTLIFGCDEKQNREINEKYVLKGIVDGIENDTWIYLSLVSNVVDSTKISESEFEFEGKIIQPTEFNLFIKNTQNYISIWIEPGILNFSAKSGEFRDAKITGSKTQKEKEILSASIKDYRNYRDSLSTILRNPQSNDSLKKSASEGLQVIYNNHLELEQEFIKNNPRSYVSGWLIDFLGRPKHKNYLMF